MRMINFSSVWSDAIVEKENIIFLFMIVIQIFYSHKEEVKLLNIVNWKLCELSSGWLIRIISFESLISQSRSWFFCVKLNQKNLQLCLRMLSLSQVIPH